MRGFERRIVRLGLGVRPVGFEVRGLQGFCVGAVGLKGLGFRCAGCGVKGLGFRVQGLGVGTVGLRVYGVGFRVSWYAPQPSRL